MPIPVVLVGHGRLPSGIADAAEMILGRQDRLSVCELHPADSPDQFREKLTGTIDGVPEVLVLADVLGGTPANTVSLLALSPGFGRAVELVAGVNLPMLLEVLTSAASDVSTLAGVARSAGQDGVADVLTKLRASAGKGSAHR